MVADADDYYQLVAWLAHGGEEDPEIVGPLIAQQKADEGERYPCPLPFYQRLTALKRVGEWARDLHAARELEEANPFLFHAVLDAVNAEAEGEKLAYEVAGAKAKQAARHVEMQRPGGPQNEGLWE